MLKPFLKTGVALARQEKIIQTITANPMGSYVFSGAPGAGKTTMMRGLELLARAHRHKNYAVYSKTAMQYQDDVIRLSRGERVQGFVKPSVFSDNAHGILWAVYLDDIDKISGSEFVMLQLFGLLNAVCDERNQPAQLVLTTNMNKVEFKKFFGDAIAWRVFQQCLWVSMEREQAAA
jgi:chromosomal replication initiation ATPase DnaA